MQNWLGISLDFNNVEDKTSESSSFELLKEGFYRATIESANKSVLGQNSKPALTITLTLDDFDNKKIVHNLFLPEAGDSENAIKFKKENLRNFFTRFAYRQLTKEEFSKLDSAIVNAELQKITTTQPNFAGAKVLVHIKQEPFISQDREIHGIKFTETSYDSVINNATKPILKLLQEKESKGVVFENFPVILFSNKIAAHGFGFYNDYDEKAELKNSKSYDFIQSIPANSNNTTNNDTIDEVAF